MNLTQRQAGVLMHPTSLPSPYGIGDLGPEAVHFLDWMAESGFALWQVLPLNPTGYGDSPYQAFSAFAGNPYLVSPDLLAEEGLLDKADLKHHRFPADRVDYGPVIEYKTALLRKAHENYLAGDFPRIKKAIAQFAKRPTVKLWLDDYALFIALKGAHGGAVWNTWGKPLRSFDEQALAKARKELAAEINFHIFAQFLFFEQWDRLRAEAHKRGIKIVGDMPIYVAYDSADTWAHQKLFKLKANGTPTHVAGVPPDYFSATGQLWGNPIYRYDIMHKRGYQWWISRVRCIMEQVDYIRLDHFRGFEAYWQVPYGEKTAINGKWVKGPREPLFQALADALGDIPIIAENLGVITPNVEKLRARFGLPGMKVLQFGWGVVNKKPIVPDPDSVFQPHKVDADNVVYTGTHDNPTTLQWWNEFASAGEKEHLAAYFNLSSADVAPHEVLTRAAFASLSNAAIIPMQDLLGLGGEARMNFPGKESGNWTWRMDKHAATKQLAAKLRQWLLLYERHAQQRAIAQEYLDKQSAEERARKP